MVVLSTGVRATEGWLEELAEVAAKRQEAGVVVPRSNEGSDSQRIRPGYRTPEEGLAAFTGKNRKKNRGIWKQISRPSGGCLMIRRDAYAAAGGLPPEFRSWAGWAELFRRMEEGGWTIGCALGSYVHFDSQGEGVSEPDASETQAVLSLAGLVWDWGRNQALWPNIDEFLRTGSSSLPRVAPPR